MEYFTLAAKKEKGCPLAIGAMLYDKFYDKKEADKVDVGRFPWYDFHYDMVFDKELCLIVKDRLWDFDIRMESRYFVVSSEFLALMQDFSAPIRSSAPVQVFSTSGEPISTREYHILNIIQTPIMDIAGADSDYELSKTGTVVRRMNRLCIKPDFVQHFIKIANTLPAICSDKFRVAAIERGVKGVDFIPLIDQSQWEEYRKRDRLIKL
ncbi:MAG: hypothetical protein LBR25_07350 [Erysipelotrichaceae bacterium]|jgi:hypothetical protein|nr:hypothetical protein [Erysipelotrichaceae bacterium]